MDWRRGLGKARGVAVIVFVSYMVTKRWDLGSSYDTFSFIFFPSLFSDKCGFTRDADSYFFKFPFFFIFLFFFPLFLFTKIGEVFLSVLLEMD